MPCCKISDCAQMSKTIIAVRHFGLGGRESLETAVTNLCSPVILCCNCLISLLTRSVPICKEYGFNQNGTGGCLIDLVSIMMLDIFTSQ